MDMNFKTFLMALGAAFLLLIASCIVTVVWRFITETIDTLKYRYRRKHRFDKPPTAKCYCVDCRWHNNETNRCYRFHEKNGRLTADSWFCYEAEPRKKEK